MKNAKNRLPLALVAFLAALACSCSTFPKEQLTLDLANELAPVTLNDIGKAAHVRTFSYDAGYKSTSVSSTSSGGGVTVSTTLTMSANLNQPIGTQMQSLFIHDPDWAAIDSLAFSVDLSSLLGVVSSTSYELKADTEIPFGK
jgi:hypothetical protein